MKYASGLIRDKPFSDSLMHYGIMGQKWGVRRYQNEDGSLTPEGKKRYGVALLSVAASYAAKKVAKYAIKKQIVKMEVAKYNVNARSSQITNKDIKKLAKSGLNKFERQQLYELMADDQRMTFDSAYKQANKSLYKRMAASTAAFLAAYSLASIAMTRNPDFQQKVTNNKKFMDFMDIQFSSLI